MEWVAVYATTVWFAFVINMAISIMAEGDGFRRDARKYAVLSFLSPVWPILAIAYLAAHLIKIFKKEEK